MQKEEKKSSNKHWLMIGVNLVLSLISVYLFEFWFKKVLALENEIQLAENLAIVALTVVTYFVAKTYYIKGVMNTAKKILVLIGLGIAILALMLLSVKVPADIVYPFSGIILVSLAFYMLSMSAGTLNTIGMVGLALILATPIAFLKWFNTIGWDMVIDLSQFAVFIILFIGGTWSQIQMAIHGIRGVNNTGGSGDDGDGDGDTGDE
jgi:hypothetical protein